MITKQEVKNYVKEFLEQDGMVTIEFSVHKETLEETFNILNSEISPSVVWLAHSCSTCEKYHGAGYVHVELHDKNSKYTKASIGASNLLMRTVV